jgi:hypothetical protein
MKQPVTSQSLFAFEQVVVDAEAAEAYSQFQAK